MKPTPFSFFSPPLYTILYSSVSSSPSPVHLTSLSPITSMLFFFISLFRFSSLLSLFIVLTFHVAIFISSSFFFLATTSSFRAPNVHVTPPNVSTRISECGLDPEEFADTGDSMFLEVLIVTFNKGQIMH
uniref:Uncharacterized protein n=1 Tax=Cacopsylla melanoneura TaxID=428564 RepID=A0A8D9FK37_9HEMI